MPPDSPPPQEFVVPDNVRASGANGARPPAEPLHPVLPNATENPGRVDSRYYKSFEQGAGFSSEIYGILGTMLSTANSLERRRLLT